MSSISMTQPTNVSQYVEGVNASLIQYVLTPLSEWLAGGPKDTSVASMMAVLQLPSSGRVPNSAAATPSYSAISNMNIPNFLKSVGTISPMGDKSKSKAKAPAKPKKPVVTGTDPNSRPCIYVYQRGNKPGTQCGRASISGAPYCKNCIKKKGVENQLNKTGTSTLTATASSSVVPPLGVTTVSSSMLTSNPPKSNQDQPVLDVEEIPERPGYFLEQTHHFIVHLLPDETAVAIKVKVGDGERDLTESEKEIANAMALATLSNDVQAPDTDDQQESEQIELDIPKIPQLPTLPSFSR